MLPSVSPCPSFVYTVDLYLENLQDLLISSLPNKAGCSKYRQLALVLSYNLLRLSCVQLITLHIILMSLLHHTWMLELVLEEEQIVCGCHCYDILCGVPRCMQNLFIEVKAVDTDFILLAFASCTNFSRFQYGFRFCNVP